MSEQPREICTDNEGNTSSLYKAAKPNSMMMSATEMLIMMMMTKETHFRSVGPPDTGKARRPETLLSIYPHYVWCAYVQQNVPLCVGGGFPMISYDFP